MKIFFLIRSLENGGAERQLTVLANELGRRGHDVLVGVFHRGGVHEASLDPSAVRLIDLGKGSGISAAGFAIRLLRTVRKERPDVLHGYLSAGNLGATLGQLVSPRSMLAWGMRDSNMEFRLYSRTTQFIYRLACLASRRAGVMIFNSNAGLQYWKGRGLAAARSVCIPNGIDVERFAPDFAAGRAMRHEWGVADSAELVGMVGRFDPMKDHRNFLHAAHRIARVRPNARFVCVGAGSEEAAARLKSMASELGLQDHVLWPGATDRMRGVYNALDVFCLASAYGEGFPNVVGEAMACGRPCVVTDVGDAKMIAGDVARVVPAKNPDALAEAVLELLSDRPFSAPAIRARIVERFTIGALATLTEEALRLTAPSFRSLRPAQVFVDPI